MLLRELIHRPVHNAITRSSKRSLRGSARSTSRNRGLKVRTSQANSPWFGSRRWN